MTIQVTAMAYRRILTGEPVPRSIPVSGLAEPSGHTDLLGQPLLPAHRVESRPGTIADPRPDLAEDSHLWPQVFTLALALDVKASRKKALFAALHGMRIAGTRLVKSDKTGKLVFRPLVGKDGWKSEAEYKQAAAKYLRPYDRDMKELLRQLNQEEDEDDVAARRECPWR